jgi:xanthine dehydrogenase small subunit
VPANLDDFAALYAKRPDATVVAGATDVGLWVTKRFRAIEPALFIGGLDELKTVGDSDGALRIGAGVSYSEARAALAARIPALARLIDRIGGEQVRNMGTIGGNIANGSPIGDMPPALIALGATLVLRKGAKRRRLPLEDFFIAYGKQDRKAGEFVESIEVPIPATDTLVAFHKVSKRRDEDITSTLGAFAIAVADGLVTSARIAYGGMAATPKRARAVEMALAGKPWTRATVEAAMGEYIKDFSPITDMRASADYRMTAARNLLLRTFLEATGGGRPVSLRRHEAA